MSTIKYKLANAPMGLVAMEAITEIEQLEQELQKNRERHEKCMIGFGIKLTEVQDKHDELLNELQKTREQLEIAEKVIEFYGDKDNWYCDEFSYSDWCDCITKTDVSPELIGGKLARQYFKDKENKE